NARRSDAALATGTVTVLAGKCSMWTVVAGIRGCRCFRGLRHQRPVAHVNGIRYAVLRLEGGVKVRFLLRNEAGELFGVYGRNAQQALSAAPLELKLSTDNPFRKMDLFETDEGGLVVRTEKD